jgi:hypothetical protein
MNTNKLWLVIRIVHERCDRNMRFTDYRISAYELGTLEELILKLAYLSETQKWFVATNWQSLVRKILEDTHGSVNDTETKVHVS